ERFYGFEPRWICHVPRQSRRRVMNINQIKAWIFIDDLLLFEPAPVLMLTFDDAFERFCWEPISLTQDGHHHRHREIPVTYDCVNGPVECVQLLFGLSE